MKHFLRWVTWIVLAVAAWLGIEQPDIIPVVLGIRS